MGQKIRVVHHTQVQFCLKSVLDHSEFIWKDCGKHKFFKNNFRWCTTMAFGHVKIKYGPGCTPFKCWVVLKICFRSFLLHREVLWKIEFFKNTFRWCTSLTFGTLIGHVKINFGSENKSWTSFKGWVLPKISFLCA